MNMLARIRQIEMVLARKLTVENLIIFYDEEVAEGYQPREHDFVVVCEYV